MQPKMRTLVINLERRPDRWDTLISQLSKISILATERIAAVDGIGQAHLANPPFTTAQESACWRSHALALGRASCEIAPVLILEDDALFNESLDWDHLLSAFASMMVEREIDVLQIGFIDAAYGIRHFEKYFEWIYGLAKRRLIKLETSQVGAPRVMLNSFRAGAHAYLVSPKAAETLMVQNNPAAFPADDFLTHLAINGRNGSGLLIGRTTRSWVAQDSRSKKGGLIDSDI